ncbi:MAG: 4Fe-4S dicluster domain-containing protein [Deltaproteobacteria bacterium]|nr:4Fe-4S dicluster domain-containing protein [Deltaproteobacteria bacterium]
MSEVKQNNPPIAGAAGRPGEEEAARERQHFDINIYRDWCKSCGICAALCPKQALTLNEEGEPVVVDPDICGGCGWCELHCPDFAISVRPRRSTQKASPEAED